MAHGPHSTSAAILALIGLVTPPASAQSAAPASGVNRRPHRVAADLGGFLAVKEDRPGVAFGLGYGYRPVSGLELGAGFRYFVRPSYQTVGWISQQTPAPGEPVPPRQREVEPAFHMWALSALARGYLSFDAQDRFELGLMLRAGVLSVDELGGVCCKELALAPDFRARLWPRTAVAFSPQLSIASTGADPTRSRYHVDSLFGYASVWLSVVQTL